MLKNLLKTTKFKKYLSFLEKLNVMNVGFSGLFWKLSIIEYNIIVLNI